MIVFLELTVMVFGIIIISKINNEKKKIYFKYCWKVSSF
jgi:hypothetical protein